MSALVDQVQHAVREHQLLPTGRPVLVAVSGGLDSMVLLDVLHRLSPVNKWRLVVAHLNHTLRGGQSNADEKLVLRTAKKLGLEAISERADVASLAKGEKLSLEMAGRKARHGFLACTARRRRIRTIALAHHADDQLELFFLRLLRGSGGEGLGGMRWARPSPVDPRMMLVRPLLEVSKTILEAYARENGIRFRDDASNDSLDFQRNRIRHELLPALKRYQPALPVVIARVMDILGAEAEFARGIADVWLRENLDESVPEGVAGSPEQGDQGGAESGSHSLLLGCPFDGLPVAVQRRVIHQQLLSAGIALDFGLVEDLRKKPGKAVSAQGLRLVRSIAGHVRVWAAENRKFNTQCYELDLSRDLCEVEFGSCRFRWWIVPNKVTDYAGGDNAAPPGSAGWQTFDAGKVGQTVILRHWRPGDRFQPIGMRHPVKLQDVFTNSKVPRDARRQLVVAQTVSGEIFWVEGQRISERFKLTEDTGLRLHWAWNRAKPL